MDTDNPENEESDLRAGLADLIQKSLALERKLHDVLVENAERSKDSR